MLILLIEDNPRISDFIVRGLKEYNHTVELAQNGVEAKDMIVSREWDIILLDIMLPDTDGLEIIQHIRQRKINTPILVISALSEADDKIKAFDYGADDYLAKPFVFRELMAHINALTRRVNQSYNEDREILECADLRVDVSQHHIERGDTSINLTIQEFKLLKILLENKDRIVSRSELLDSVWGVNGYNTTNVVDVYISYLRNKIDSDHNIKLIRTIKGRGYMIQSDETAKILNKK